MAKTIWRTHSAIDSTYKIKQKGINNAKIRYSTPGIRQTHSTPMTLMPLTHRTKSSSLKQMNVMAIPAKSSFLPTKGWLGANPFFYPNPPLVH